MNKPTRKQINEAKTYLNKLALNGILFGKDLKQLTDTECVVLALHMKGRLTEK